MRLLWCAWCQQFTHHIANHGDLRCSQCRRIVGTVRTR